MPEAGRFPVGPTRPAEIQNSIELGRRTFIGAEAKQFQIYMDGDGDLAVSAGRIYTTEINPVADTALWGMSSIAASAFTPFTPTNSKDYHFFLELNRVSVADEGQAAASWGDLYVEEFSSVSVTYKETTTGTTWDIEDQTEAQGAATYNYIYLGKAAIDGSGNATITQENYGPFTPPVPSYIYNFVSSEANNGLTTGGAGDGDLFVAVIHDGANQQLRFNKAGGDKGAYLEIIGGDAITVDGSTAGQPSIKVTPAGAVAKLNPGTTASASYVQAEAQATMDKIDAVIDALKTAKLMSP